MPASSTSSSLSWALYIGAAFSLCIVLATPLSALSSISKSGEGLRIVEGVAAVIDELKPGMTTSFEYGSPGFEASIHMGGHSLTLSYGNESWSRYVAWPLPAMVLTPGTLYEASVKRGVVEVLPSV